jgi:hypothetical protein
MTSYPEKIPKTIKPFEKFYFNFENSISAKQELENQIDSIEERIEKIVEHFTLQDLPIIRHILNFSSDREELKKLAKGLDRVADLIEARNALTPKLHVIQMAEKDPNWFASTFGDFSSDIDSAVNSLFDKDIFDDEDI